MTAAGLTIAFFGSSLVSTYWNGAATYYRGIIRALDARGHRTTFFEPDAFERQRHRDMDDPPWAGVIVYAPREPDVVRALEAARGVDLVVKASGVGVFDDYLEREVLKLKSDRTAVVFWDVDAPATLERVQDNPHDPFRALIAQYDLILTYGGGEPVVSAYRALGARECIPVYNALDPDTHHPVAPDPRFAGLLGFLGNRLPDREARVHEFFFKAARSRPSETFLLGGNGWADVVTQYPNVRYVEHVASPDHNAFNCTPQAVLNINRASMARFGFSPPTRVFEAAGASACLISDAWAGLEAFLEPDHEVLVARNGDEVIGHLEALSPKRAATLGEAARLRVLAEHTYSKRALQLESIFKAESRIRHYA